MRTHGVPRGTLCPMHIAPYIHMHSVHLGDCNSSHLSSLEQTFYYTACLRICVHWVPQKDRKSRYAHARRLHAVRAHVIATRHAHGVHVTRDGVRLREPSMHLTNEPPRHHR